jgi:hypothetical protein
MKNVAALKQEVSFHCLEATEKIEGYQYSTCSADSEFWSCFQSKR